MKKENKIKMRFVWIGLRKRIREEVEDIGENEGKKMESRF